MNAPQTHAATIQESLEEIAARAEAIYEKQYKQKYEKKNPGSYVVINIQNKKAYVGEFAEKLLQRAREEDQYGVFHLMRVGSPTTFKVSC
ncbi:MAG: hypothetical protein OXF47_01675 [Nitrospira sp.]|nr:hypothetical protein [Nitrospira sp.]